MKKYLSVNKKSQSQKKENIMLPKRMLMSNLFFFGKTMSFKITKTQLKFIEN